MACVTLKRPVEVLGSPHVEQEPTTKRRRCGPSLIPSTPPSGNSPGKSYKRRKRILEADEMPVSPSSSTKQLLSPFLNTPPQHTDRLVASIEAELKRLQRRKMSTDSNQLSQPFPGPTQNHGGKDQPIFTLKQVTLVCQRMIKEREEELREEYDKILSTKLAEQYDAFVKFNHDQVERRLAESAFSYVS